MLTFIIMSNIIKITKINKKYNRRKQNGKHKGIPKTGFNIPM